jgi:phenylalanyl-tRNA synthetase beta chain
MKFTYNWLKEFVVVDLSADDLARSLTMAGLEVESFALVPDAESGREDWLFEIAVTPNRGDCLSIAGIAREVAVLTGADLKAQPADVPAKKAPDRKRVGVTIQDALVCRRYSARIIDEVKIAPSPAWLKWRLETCGIRSINNVVDVTNYVMLESGQPLHAFDLDRLQHKSIIVRAAGALQSFTTLDGVEREVAADDLLICAGPQPVALAGIMGGIDSEVHEATSSVLLESANFSPVSIRRTARRLALHSEASHRFERGVDPEGTVAALNRAAWLLTHVSAGRPAGWIDRYPGKSKPPTIIVREDRIERLLGTKIETTEATEILNRLGMTVKRPTRRRALAIVPPARRADLTRETDIIEELARVRGYDRIPSTLPLARNAGAPLDLQLAWERRLRALLTGAGLTEVVNLPFTTESLNRSAAGLFDELPYAVAVQNPLSKDSAEMRRSLVPGLIETLRFNLAFKAGSFHVFHLGKVFAMNAEEVREKQCIAGLLYGPRDRQGLRDRGADAVDFSACKGLVESILELFRLDQETTWSRAQMALLHPGQAALLTHQAEPLGYCGQAHPDFSQELELPAFFLFELDFTKLLQYAPRRIAVTALHRFPAIERDVAMVVDRDFASEEVIRWVKELKEPLIEYVKVFDQYAGAPIPEGKKSLAYKISYRAGERTLTDAEVNGLHQNLIDRLGKAFGAELRS